MKDVITVLYSTYGLKFMRSATAPESMVAAVAANENWNIHIWCGLC